MEKNCENCGKKLYTEIFNTNVGGRCRFCGKLLCNECIREGLCPSCWEKHTGRKYEKSSGCFITEACVGAMGLPDDCKELRILRQFRDNYLQKSIRGRNIIRKYYHIAPKIVEEIKRRPDSNEILKEIFKHIKIIVSQIEQGNIEIAIAMYRSKISQLEREYLTMLNGHKTVK